MSGLKNENEYKRLYYGDDEFQFGHLRLPDTDGPFPVIMIIHGGFWKAGFSLDIMEQVAIDLTERGYATWNVEYRRVGNEGGGYPGTMHDIENAANFLLTMSKDNQLDLNQFIVTGHSAGGQLALWLTKNQLIKNEESYEKEAHIPVKGVISLAGITDLKLMWEVDNYFHKIIKNFKKDNPVEQLVGGSPLDIPEKYKAISPVNLLPLQVPQVLIHGDLDLNVPIKFSELYYTLAKHLDDPVKMITLPNVEHFEVTDPESEYWPIIISEISSLLDKIGERGS